MIFYTIAHVSSVFALLLLPFEKKNEESFEQLVYNPVWLYFNQQE